MTDCPATRAGGPTGYTLQAMMAEGAALLAGVSEAGDLAVARRRLAANAAAIYAHHASLDRSAEQMIRSRDCLRALTTMLTERADGLAGFSLAQALWDAARAEPRDDLREGFFAEIIHLVRGLDCRSQFQFLLDARGFEAERGRQAAIARSEELDDLWAEVDARMSRLASGMSDAAIERRTLRRRHVLASLGGSEGDWNDWTWQAAHVLDSPETLARAVTLSTDERAYLHAAHTADIPFAVTPYYASLFDDAGGQDRAIRAQVLPPQRYVEGMANLDGQARECCDFMREADTSPVDLVTRRYPAIAILKPFNTCPQICVYCQRNWELKPAMAADALADPATIEAAVDWIARHSAIREVLITGGDPLAMDDERIAWILEQIAAIDHVDVIRIGSRVPVTMPMRVTPQLADLLGGFRLAGRRDVAVVTHVEHPYEITPDLAAAVDRLRRAGLSVYNQQVYTFYVSRRFETALLRLMLRRVGIDPYYTFAPKAKPETLDYRVPLARILQERKEEARLLPGLRRTDEPVFNVPGLGKNYLRATQHHDLLSILGDGSRMYEFHPWEKNVVQRRSYMLADMPILDYLRRLEGFGEDPADYASIWYYF